MTRIRTNRLAAPQVTMWFLTAVLCLTARVSGVGAAASESRHGESRQAEARGVWLTLSLASTKQRPEAIAQTLADHNLNFVLVYHQPQQQLRGFIDACNKRKIEVPFWLTPHELVPDPKDEWRCTGYDYRSHEFRKMTPMYFNPEYTHAARTTAEKLLADCPADGIHLDGVRYGLPWDSLGPESRQEFEKDTGIKVERFPEDIIRVERIEAANVGDPGAWSGRYTRQWAKWRCEVVADFFGAVADYVKERHPTALFSNACMTDSASALYYGVDYALLAPHLDFLIPMAYFNRYGRTPEWSVGRTREIALVARSANPRLHVYAGVATYSHSHCRIWIADAVKRLQEEGKLTREQVTSARLLHYVAGADMCRSAVWLHECQLIDDELFARMENAIITDDEILEAVRLSRARRDGEIKEGAREYVDQARVEGLCFFRYFCMFPDNTEGVGGDLWGKLKTVFPQPAALPHSIVP